MSSREDIEAQLQEIMQQNELLLKENELFMTFLQRNNCLDDDEDPLDLPVKGKNRKGGKDKPQTLTLAQRHELASKESEQLLVDLKELEKRTQRETDSLKAVIEETELRIAEIRKEIYDFNRILGGDDNIRLKKFDADKIVKFFDDSLVAKEKALQKLVEKNTNLRAQIAKVESQLKQKEDQGDSLQSIDFHQLQIENSQYNQKIDERNQELLELKKTTGRTVQVLNTTKQELNELLNQTQELTAGNADKAKIIADLQVALTQTEGELEQQQRINSKYSRQQASADMPQILDYVNQKSREFDLNLNIKNLERKVELAEMGGKRARMLIREAAAMGLPYSVPSE